MSKRRSSVPIPTWSEIAEYLEQRRAQLPPGEYPMWSVDGGGATT